LPAGEPRSQTPARLEASVARLAEVRAELGELGRAFREVAASSRAMLGGAGDQSDPVLTAELEQLGQHVLRFNERVRSFVRRVDEELARSSRLLSSAVDRAEEG
jgi:phosphate uptake regulator